MKIKKGDKVVVIAGKDRGKTGTVSKALPRSEQVLIDGVNVKKKHLKAHGKAKSGQIIEKAYPLHVSNVMFVDPKTSARTRISITRKDGARLRIAKKSGQELS